MKYTSVNGTIKTKSHTLNIITNGTKVFSSNSVFVPVYNPETGEGVFTKRIGGIDCISRTQGLYNFHYLGEHGPEPDFLISLAYRYHASIEAKYESVDQLLYGEIYIEYYNNQLTFSYRRVSPDILESINEAYNETEKLEDMYQTLENILGHRKFIELPSTSEYVKLINSPDLSEPQYEQMVEAHDKRKLELMV